MSDPIATFFDRDVQTDGCRVIFSFASHAEAIGALNAARAAIRPQPATEGGDPTYHRGRVLPHTSEPGSSLPDVGISVGLGAGSCLFAGEVPDIGAKGWSMAIYTDTDRHIVAKDIDREAGSAVIERLGDLLRMPEASVNVEAVKGALMSLDMARGKLVAALRPATADPLMASKVRALVEARRGAAQLLWDMLYMQNGAADGMTRDEVQAIWDAAKDQTGYAAVNAFLAALRGVRHA